ncbi:MAG: thiamine diphosphokinase [Ignavibacteria bacterium]
MTNPKTILFLNGDLPSVKSIKKYCKPGDYVICADGGANGIAKSGIVPNIILGDLDSITTANLNYFRKKGVEIRKISEQDTTDFEKALFYILENNLNNLIVFGAVSSRPDHTLNNFSILKRYYKILDVKMIDKEFEIFYVKNNVSFKSVPGKTVSFMAMPVAKGITTKGLKYSLKNETLEFGIREGTLNKTSAKTVNLSFKSGHLLLFIGR